MPPPPPTASSVEEERFDNAGSYKQSVDLVMTSRLGSEIGKGTDN